MNNGKKKKKNRPLSHAPSRSDPQHFRKRRLRAERVKKKIKSSTRRSRFNTRTNGDVENLKNRRHECKKTYFRSGAEHRDSVH